MPNKVTAEQVDSLLPQTQCGLCGYNGCKPYAEALAENKAEINLCPPGGVRGLIAIANLLNKDATAFIPEMEAKSKPAMRAVIRESECIGCTKCIQACPVDAILGSGKLMHTVIADECTGCELCIAPCPVDCIDMVTIPEQIDKKDHFRKRYQAHQTRLQHNEKSISTQPKHHPIEDKKAYIQAALLRVKMKKRHTT